jgi:hypothetical protein
MRSWPVLAVAAIMAVSAGPLLAAPGDVNAHSFYVDAQELVGKGMRAMFDRRTKPMLAQLKDAGDSVRAENDAGRARGAPLYCVPDAMRKKGAGPQFVIDRLGAIPKAQRERMTLKQAWRSILMREYPCR